MSNVQTFRDLMVWNVSVELVVVIYRVTDQFPRAEVYGLTSQTRRAGSVDSGEHR